nr:hypothetical protein [Tanacetum cinerariifolium]
MSWIGLPEFADDTITDYTRPPPSIESNPNDLQNNSPSVFENGKSTGSILSKLEIKFVKAADSPTVIKTNKDEIVRKPYVRYAEITSTRTTRPNMNAAQPKMTSFYKPAHSYVKRPFQRNSALITQSRVLRVPTVNRKFPTVNRKFLTGNSKVSTADLGNKGKAGNSQNNIDEKGYWDSGCSQHMTGNISYLSDYEPYDRGVLVNKSRNKTPYELFNGKTPAIGFLKPFGCHVMILNTLDHLGKFKAKGDEGYFIGYSMSSKAFRVFNKRTKRVEENLHVDFLKNKLIEKGAGPNWLFDIDTLTNSMNYVPVVSAGTTSTNFSGTKEAASQDVKKDKLQSHCYFNNPPADQMETLIVETLIPTVSSPVPTACLDDSPQLSSDTRLISKRVTGQDDTPSLDNILTLLNRFKDILGVTTNIDDSNGVEADLGNMEYNILASPTPIFRIHKDHPKSQIIGPVDSPVQTRTKSKEMEEQSFIATIHQNTDPALLQFCLFSCFLSQEEPKKIYDALKDPSWNKKDGRGIVIRNKARLVAQGHTQEEGIDYEEVFTPVARIEVIRLFLAYASFMGFTFYQMDVKSVFLYGTIDEEVYVMQPLGFQDLKFPARVYKVEKAIEFEALMHEKFQMSAMGELNFFLGLSANTPMDKENPWGKDRTGKDVDLHLYRSMIGSLMYLTASRPYIMFAVCACARHQVTPKECHLHAVKMIFRYLKGHTKLGLWYPKESPFDLVAYSDDCGHFNN